MPVTNPLGRLRRWASDAGLRRRDAKKILLVAFAAAVLAVVAVVALVLALVQSVPAWWGSVVLAGGGALVGAAWLARRYRTLARRRRAKLAEPRIVAAIVAPEAGDAPESPGAVSVVIPAFCEEKGLGAALDSLLAQTYLDWRAIVVDDQSHDATSAVAVGYANRDPRISVVRLRRNSGLPAARNAGLTQVDTPFVVFLDGDDAFFPDALERRVAALVADPTAAGCYGKIRQVPFDADWRAEAAQPNRRAASHRITLVSSAGENPFGIHEVLLRTDHVLALGGFTEALRTGGEDVDFWARALRSGYEFIGTGYTDCIYRQTPTSMVSAGATAHLERVVGLLDASWQAQLCHAEIAHRPGLDGDLGGVLRHAMVENRLLRYLGMAAQAQDHDALEHVRGELADVAPLALSRVSALNPIVVGVRRSMKRTGTEDAAQAQETAAAVLHSIEHLFADVEPHPLPRRDHPAWAVLVEHRAQVAAVLDVLADVPADRRPAFLCSDSVDADMGGLALLVERAPDAVWRSIPDYLLEGVRYDVVAVPVPVTWVGRLVADVAGDRGTAVHQVRFPWTDLVTVDDDETREAASNVLPVPAPMGDISELATLAVVRRDVERREVAPARRVLPGLSSRDGSTGDYRGLDLPTLERLMELKDRHRGERCVIIGNGPSLNRTDLEALRGTPTFGVNGIYYADTRLPEPLAFYVVEDTSVFKENTADVLAYGREKAGTFILPTLYRPHLGPDDDPVLFRMNGGFYKTSDPSFARPRFSTNAAEAVYCGQSVTIINLQLAYWMGFSEVGMIGMDFSYAIPQGTEIKGDIFTSAGDDPNHFDSRYFGAGKTWKDPKLHRVLANYELAKAIYASDGRRIVNCTAGGALEAFERQDLAAFTRG